LAGAAPD